MWEKLENDLCFMETITQADSRVVTWCSLAEITEKRVMLQLW